MRLGIFGGTFDPPHLGHLILAAEAYHQCRLDRLLWVLTPDPPHKPDQKITPLAIRLEMVQACLADAPEFELSTVDIDRPPPHYAADTVQILREQHPHDELIYLMGSDSLLHLHTWHSPLPFIQACDRIGVTRRSDEQINLPMLDARLPGLAEKVQFVVSMILGISSSEIRRRIAEGAPVRYYLHPEVYQLMRVRGMYLPGE
ncbi:MAG: nicotinate (nicotinamide) nucleotide adenylyltransferase [Anaerolineales bacterium]|nr:nicotinate (nicotinamide) nucleotide adenylyltransferase [Anaerolineales bacterium]